jgi:CHAD domain-containing protein
MTTDRTSIRRRLAIRGRAHRPPRGVRKAGHGLIVAPLAATVAATVAVGVGVAFVRSERERRRSRKLKAERQLGLRPRESLAHGLRRMALSQVDLALELLGRNGNGAGPAGAPDERAVHDTRKAIKRLRALLRLLEHQLASAAYQRDDAALRNIAQQLAGARDAAVMLNTLDSLIQRHPHKLARRPAVRKLRRRLNAQHQRTQQLTLSDPATRATVLGELHTLRWRIAGWTLPDEPGIQLVGADLEHRYRQGRTRMRRAARGKRANTIAMHQWRKRVKDLRYTAETLDRRGGGASSLRELARRADELGELLGEEHDLAVFAERLRASAKHKHPFHTDKRTRRQLLRLIAKRRRALRKQALRQGARLYRQKPSRFVRRVRGAHAQRTRKLS